MKELTNLDLVLEPEPAITNKVKDGAELTFTTMSYISYYKRQQDLHVVILHVRGLGVSGGKNVQGIKLTSIDCQCIRTPGIRGHPRVTFTKHN